MASKRETAVLGLVAALGATGALVSRASDIPDTIPPEGWITVSEGSAEVETVMSPLTYLVDQAVTLDVLVAGVDEYARDTAMDVLLVAVSGAITADLTLDGSVDYAEVGSPDFEAFETDGPAKAARVPVVLSFSSADTPLT